MKGSTLLSLVGAAVIMLVIGTAFGSVGFPTTKNETTTLLSSVTSTQTSTLTQILLSSVVATQTGTLYEVEFTQKQPCPYGGGWTYPWAVVLNNQTVVEPSNATLGVSEGAIAHYDVNYSAIWFSLSNGTYSYKILPRTYFGQSGNVTVADSGAVIQVYPFFLAEGCSSTSSG
jgi:hypothetical protein